MITPQNLLSHEWISLKVTLAESPDRNLKDMAGYVRDETRNMFVIESGKDLFTVSKSHNVFVVTLPEGQDVTVDGTLLVRRPEDRIKRGFARW